MFAASKDWDGLKALWIGTKGVWKMFYDLGLMDSEDIIGKTQDLKPAEWDEGFADELYGEVKKNSLYITNIGKCTQVYARPLKNVTFKDYIDNY